MNAAKAVAQVAHWGEACSVGVGMARAAVVERAQVKEAAAPAEDWALEAREVVAAPRGSAAARGRPRPMHSAWSCHTKSMSISTSIGWKGAANNIWVHDVMWFRSLRRLRTQTPEINDS